MNKEVRETILITGGCRSGKSRFGQEWAEEQGAERIFVATARASDKEMVERIRRHQRARGDGWMTIEEPIRVNRVIREHGAKTDVILVDCMTLWVTNLLMEGLSDVSVLKKVRELAQTLRQIPCSMGLVTNEVGWGIVPDYPLGRRFQDLAGSANQVLAKSVDRVVLMVAGLPTDVKQRIPSGERDLSR